MSLLRAIRDPEEFIRSRIRLNAQYKEVFNSESGKAVLAHLMQVAGMATQDEDFTGDKLVAQKARKNLVLGILKFLERDEVSINEELRKIIKEQGDGNG